jgi:hypothetical protein
LVPPLTLLVSGEKIKGNNMFYPIDLGWILITAASIMCIILIVKGVDGWNE